MPVIHSYTNGSGLYIKSRYRGRMTTYQVSAKGVELLSRHGLHDGSRLRMADLLKLIELKYVYTGGSGPGQVADDFCHYEEPVSNFVKGNGDLPFSRSPVAGGYHQTPQQGSNEGVTAFLIVLFIILFIVGLGLCIHWAGSVIGGCLIFAIVVGILKAIFLRE